MLSDTNSNIDTDIFSYSSAPVCFQAEAMFAIDLCTIHVVVQDSRQTGSLVKSLGLHSSPKFKSFKCLKPT